MNCLMLIPSQFSVVFLPHLLCSYFTETVFQHQSCSLVKKKKKDFQVEGVFVDTVTPHKAKPTIVKM